MGFFFNEAKKAPVKKAPTAKPSRGHVPIESLRTLGCQVCPHNTNDKIRSPKMEPSGVASPSVYLLGTSPSTEDDRNNNHWTDQAGDHVYRAFGDKFMRTQVRSNFITQCFGDQDVASVECCRGRIEADIMASRPLVVVTVGDPPLKWILGSSATAMISHGTWIPAKIGDHVCWVFPIMWPNFAHKKSRGPSPHQLVFEAEVREVITWVESGNHPAVPFFEGDHYAGITTVSGDRPGDLHRLAAELEALASQPNIAIDIETNGLRPYMLKDPKIITVAVGTYDRVVAFPLDHPVGWATNTWRVAAWGLFIDFLLRVGHKIAHNCAMEMEWLAYFMGSTILRQMQWEDSMAVAHTLDERPGTKSLDYQCRITFGFWLKSLSNVDTKRLLDYPIEQVLKYNGLDAKWTHRLWHTRMATVRRDRSLLAEYERKMRLAPTLVLTEMQGLPISIKETQKHALTLTRTAQELEKKIARTPEVIQYENRTRTRFSPTAPEQVLVMLRDICKRDEIRREDPRTGTVSFSTDEEALSSIPADEVPSAHLILEHRAVVKLLGTYIEPILERRIVTDQDMVHSRYSSMVAVTGRLASEDPNVQNWPKRKHKYVRSSFVALPGHAFTAADYGQIEFRVVGMASEDEALVRACWTGYDVHKFWAERMVALYPEIKDYIVSAFEVDWDEKGLKTLRQEAKNGWVFPQLFGSSVKSCAEQLHLPISVGERLAEEFWDTFPGVKRWQERLIKSYEKNLYVETLGGRKRRGAMTKNEIINMPIQGTAADIVTAGMNAISERGEAEGKQFLIPRLNVHDDLSFIIPDRELDQAVGTIVHEMCKPRFDYINVPLVVEVSVGLNWADLEEVGVYRSDKLFNLENPYA